MLYSVVIGLLKNHLSGYFALPVEVNEIFREFRFYLSIISLVAIILFFAAIVATVSLIGGSPDILSYCINITNTSTITHSLVEDSLSKVPVFITIIGGIAIYIHFFGIMEKNPNVVTDNDHGELKYRIIFQNAALLIIFTILCSISVILFIHREYLNLINIYDVFSVITASVFLLLLTRFARMYFLLIEKYEGIEAFNRFLNDLNYVGNGERRWKQWSNLYELTRQLYVGNNILSTYVFITTIAVVVLSIILKLNVFSLLFIEITLILLHLTISRVYHIPRNKYTISLHTGDGDQFADVYILQDLPDSLVLLRPGDTKVKIFKDSVKRID